MITSTYSSEVEDHFVSAGAFETRNNLGATTRQAGHNQRTSTEMNMFADAVIVVGWGTTVLCTGIWVAYLAGWDLPSSFR